MSHLIDKVKLTMKSQETEGPFELYVTRTPGYLWAQLFKWLGVHPITVTLLSIVIGALAGWFFGIESRWMNLIGMFLLIWANWFDCADGQLARMTGKTTLIGRILDGFGGDVWFFSIYFFICLRFTPQYGVWVWLLAAVSGLYCHSKQCQLADYYRNIHLFFQKGSAGSELGSSASQLEEYKNLRWNRQDWFHKLYLHFYMSYTRSQENMTPAFQQLYRKIQERYGTTLPADLCEEFRAGSRPLMPWCNVLTFDTRVGVLFLTTLLGVPWAYFLFEIIALEPLRFYVRNKHERLCQNIEKKYLSHEV